MKTTKKALLALVCAAALVFGSVFATYAYLTDTKSVTNTFTVGNVKITLDESDVDGSKTNVTTTGRDTANTYKLIPGTTYEKDPIVHVASDSENCYLFVKVVNEITAIEGDTKIAAQMAAKGWIAVDGAENIYVYVGTAEGASAPLSVAANSNITVFESFKIDGSVTNETLASYANKTITVTAYAVQAEGFESATAAKVWTDTFGKTAAE